MASRLGGRWLEEERGKKKEEEETDRKLDKA